MLRDNQGRARTARLVFLVLLLITGGIVLLGLVSSTMPELPVQNPRAWDLLMIPYGLLLVAQFIVNLVALVVLIRWLRRAYYNLHQLPGLHPEFTDGWAAGAWFVPFIGLWRPYTIAREVWNDTQLAAVGHVAQPATILGWWWVAYLGRVVVGYLSGLVVNGKGYFSTDDVLFTMADAAAIFLFAALTRYVVGRMARFEEQLVLRQQIEQLGQPAPATPAALAAGQPDYGQPEGY